MNESIGYGGAAPKPPGFTALWTKVWRVKMKGRALPARPSILRSPWRRSGRSPALPYPPQGCGQNIDHIFILQELFCQKGHLQVMANGNFNCRQREKIIVVDQPRML